MIPTTERLAVVYNYTESIAQNAKLPIFVKQVSQPLK